MSLTGSAPRSLVLADLPSWPATIQHHAWKWPDGVQPWIAPSIDLHVAVHRQVPDDPWLLVEGVAPLAADGLLAFRSSVWSSDRRLVASGTGQCYFRPAPPAT